MHEDASVPPIDLEIETAAAPWIAWRAVTDPAHVAEWFADATALGPVGSPYRLDFPNGSFVDGTVLAMDPGRSFSRTWHWDDAEATEITAVTWTVEAIAGGGSRIRLVHDGWDEAGLDADLRDDHEEYWTGFLEDLLGALEEA